MYLFNFLLVLKFFPIPFSVKLGIYLASFFCLYKDLCGYIKPRRGYYPLESLQNPFTPFFLSL